MKRALVGLMVAATFAACAKAQGPQAPPLMEAGGGGGGSGAEAATPVRIAAAMRAFRADWAAVAEGAPPPHFVDVRREGHSQSWLYDGGWRIARRDGRAILEVPFALTVPREPLSFRRYTGTAFGPNGALPARYRIEAEARSLGGSTRFGGYGEVAIQAFYVSPVTYVEVLQTDKHLYLWEAREAPPMQGKGWRQIAKVDRPARVGEWVRFGAEVDRRAGTITALIDGKAVATGRSGVISGAGPAAFTIRATGNKEEWRSLEVRELP
ncbi:MAG: hypothetical protein ACK46X_20060 [Candidatus Sericytochromatia bacterium]